MNLLQEITVTGQLASTHARLTFEFVFHNPTRQPLSPRYFFPIPKEASITGMQLLTGNRTLLRAKIVPITELGSRNDGFQLTQLDPQLYALKWENLLPEDTCTVLVECLLHLLPQNNRCRLVLPFAIPFGQFCAANPCPINLDFSLDGLEPLQMAPEDCYDREHNLLSCTAYSGTDFVRDFSSSSQYPSLIQEEFGNGLGFARIGFPKDKLLHEDCKKQVLLLLDLSHATTQKLGNTLKELLFRIANSIPKNIKATILTTSSPCDAADKDALYQALQDLPSGVGNLDDLLQAADHEQKEGCLTILVSDGGYLPARVPTFPFVLATMGAVRQTILSHNLSGEHLHFYPDDSLEKEVSHHIARLLCPTKPVELIPESSTVHDCFGFRHQDTLEDGYLDLVFSYTGQPPQAFSLWQDGKKQLTCPLTNPKILPRHPDGEQLYAIGKIGVLTELLKKTTPVSDRNIKNELATLQTKHRILGRESLLTIPTENSLESGIATHFYSAAIDNLSALTERPTIFGEGIRKLSEEDKSRLANRCRHIIYASIRSNGSIHSSLGITPQTSAEETTLSLLALLADGKTNQSVIQDALSYLTSAPKTPWSYLLDETPTKEVLQRSLIPILPDFETLLAAVKDTLHLTIAAYLLLWLSLI